MKSARYVPALLFTLVCLAACDDSSTPSASNFSKAINDKISASPLCWRRTDNNVNDRFGEQLGLTGEVPPILALAQSAGILAISVGPSQLGGRQMGIVIKKPEAWNKKSGLCYGRKIVDKIANWTQPNNNSAQVNFHWKIEPPGWATTAVLKANGIRTEGDSDAVLQLMNTGWQTVFVKLSGTYLPVGDVHHDKFKFGSDDMFDLTNKAGEVRRGTYKIDGKKVIFTIGPQSFVLLIDDEGCLYGGQFARYCEQ